MPEQPLAETPNRGDRKPSSGRRRRLILVIGLIVLIAAVVAGSIYYWRSRFYESTDDAYVRGDPVTLSARVAGNIVHVYVMDNQPLLAPMQALGVIYRALIQQATMLAYNDTFRILGIISLTLIPLMFLLKSVKGGMMLLTKTIAQEMAPKKIRVNSIGPGAIETPINEKVWRDPAGTASMRKLIPYGRIGQTTDVAPVAVWLACDQADYITGTTIFIDGGMLLYPGFPTGG